MPSFSDEGGVEMMLNALVLVFNLMTVFEFTNHGHTERLRLTDWDLDAIVRCFQFHHFQLIRRNCHNSTFYFSVGNRCCKDVITDLNRLKYRLNASALLDL